MCVFELSYVYEAGVDVVTACAAIPSGQLDTIIIIWIKKNKDETNRVKSE